jgi:hypothetical protein
MSLDPGNRHSTAAVNNAALGDVVAHSISRLDAGHTIAGAVHDHETVERV